ncbi:hypothetical protein MKEN_00996000 [Mycena kentingensis (nom. inval.)]|nr:hypothetical protein MKEN_00996000 [Mycena kentingensis (nom. inval.)]
MPTSNINSLIRLAAFFLLGSLSVFAAPSRREELLSCGQSNYYPSQYNCFEGDFLCPITNGQNSLRCGNDCYFVKDYACENGSLSQVSGTDPAADGLRNCGEARYHPSQYVCLPGNFLCPNANAGPMLRCGDACYLTSQYRCTNGQLSPA